MLALVVGTTLLGTDFPSSAGRIDVVTERGTVALLDAGDYVVLQRHGLDAYTPPHLIDHGANLMALAERGVDRVLAVCSSGSLHRDIEVGTLLAPDDFVAPELRLTLRDDARGHIVAALDHDWRGEVLSAWSEGGAEPSLRDGGVYRQMPGPRFETPAEVRVLAAQADVVGMTMAAECVIACELGLRYAAICTIDNYANGIGDRPLTGGEFEAGVASTRAKLVPALQTVLPALV